MLRLQNLARNLVHKLNFRFGFQGIQGPLLQHALELFIFHGLAIELLAGPSNQRGLL